jgi:hypothetical protein
MNIRHTERIEKAKVLWVVGAIDTLLGAMRRTFAVMLVLMVAMAALVVADLPSARGATSKPTWTTGDYWVYNLTGSAGTGFPSLGGGSSTLRYDIKGTTTIQIAGSSVAVYDAKVNLTLLVRYGSTTIALVVSGDEWFRTSDLAPAKVSLSTTYLGQTASFTLTSDPPPAIHWPLTSGDSWTVTTNITIATQFPGSSNSTSSTQTASQSVESDQSLTVPAGTFTVTPVKETISGQSNYTISYWSGTAGNAASQRSYASNGSEQGAMDLKAYNYQAGSPVPPNLLGVIVLGIPLLVWLILVAGVVIAILAFAWVRRRPPPAVAPGPPPAVAPGPPLPVQGMPLPSIPPPPSPGEGPYPPSGP